MGSEQCQTVTTDQASGSAFNLGAMVATWQPQSHRPVLWVSEPVEGGKYPQRGGIPICFPWFGAGPHGDQHPHHGLVRNLPWELVSAENGHLHYRIDTQIVASQTSAPAPFAPASWEAHLEVDFATALQVSLTFTNTGERDFTCEAALHTYFAVSDASQVQVEGLENATYLDATTVPPQRVTPTDSQAPITFTHRVDRIYQHSGSVVIHDSAWRRRLQISKTGSVDTVVWNPGEELGATTAGIGPGRWREFVCVETVNCRQHALTLQPGQTHRMTQTVQVLPL